MLNQRDFVSFIRAVKKEEKRLYDIGRNLESLGDGFIVLENPLIEFIIKFLKTAMRDEDDYISWWLFEDIEKKVWLKDGTEVDLSTPQKLYKFLRKDMRDETNKKY